MLLVISSSLYANDPQNDLLSDCLVENSIEHVFINPLRLQDLKRLELEQDSTGLRLLFDGWDINPEMVYLARNLREDCFLEVPTECEYPTLFRQKVGFFFEDIFQILNAKDWFPADPTTIRRIESKPVLLEIARSFGLRVPRITKNSFQKQGNLYRKSLGFPFTLSYDKEEKGEIAVTLENTLSESDTEGLPWQWQEQLESAGQIRCVVIGDKIHSYFVDSAQLQGKDLRSAQDDGISLKWVRQKLPEYVVTSLLSMLRHFGIKMCCPEFILTHDGELVFIDLNPCGDWYGFIDEDENHSVCNEIVQTLR